MQKLEGSDMGEDFDVDSVPTEPCVSNPSYTETVHEMTKEANGRKLHVHDCVLMQEMEGCDTEEDLDVDGISTASDETQVKNESLNLPVQTHVSKLQKVYMK